MKKMLLFSYTIANLVFIQTLQCMENRSKLPNKKISYQQILSLEKRAFPNPIALSLLINSKETMPESKLLDLTRRCHALSSEQKQELQELLKTSKSADIKRAQKIVANERTYWSSQSKMFWGSMFATMAVKKIFPDNNLCENGSCIIGDLKTIAQCSGECLRIYNILEKEYNIRLEQVEQQKISHCFMLNQ